MYLPVHQIALVDTGVHTGGGDDTTGDGQNLHSGQDRSQSVGHNNVGMAQDGVIDNEQTPNGNGAPCNAEGQQNDALAGKDAHNQNGQADCSDTDNTHNIDVGVLFEHFFPILGALPQSTAIPRS